MRIGDDASTPNLLTHFMSESGLKRDWMERYTKIFIPCAILGSHSSDNG
jgi:hypothetical protein